MAPPILCEPAAQSLASILQIQVTDAAARLGVDLDALLVNAKSEDPWSALVSGPFKSAAAGFLAPTGHNTDDPAVGQVLAGGLEFPYTFTAPIAAASDLSVLAPQDYTNLTQPITDGQACTGVVAPTAAALKGTYDKFTGLGATVLSFLSDNTHALDALFTEALGTLSNQYVLEKKTLASIESLCKKMQVLMASLDLTTVDDAHARKVSRALQGMADAQATLSQVAAQLTNSSGFSKETMDAADAGIASAAKVMCATPDLNLDLSFTGPKLLLLINELEVLLVVWRKQQRVREDLGARMTNFGADIQADVGTLYRPLIDYLRCMIAQVTAEMTGSLGAHNQAEYIGQEQRWCILLNVLRAAVGASSKIIGASSSVPTLVLTAAIDLQSVFVKRVNTTDNAVTLDSAITTLLERAYAVVGKRVGSTVIASASASACASLAADRSLILEQQRLPFDAYFADSTVKVIRQAGMAVEIAGIINASGVPGVASDVLSGNFGSMFDLGGASRTILNEYLAAKDASMLCATVPSGVSISPAAAVAPSAVSVDAVAAGSANPLTIAGSEDQLDPVVLDIQPVTPPPAQALTIEEVVSHGTAATLYLQGQAEEALRDMQIVRLAQTQVKTTAKVLGPLDPYLPSIGQKMTAQDLGLYGSKGLVAPEPGSEYGAATL